MGNQNKIECGERQESRVKAVIWEWTTNTKTVWKLTTVKVS